MKIGVALAGGGIKGAAHIGALKALEENGIQIDVIAGTSIGSIVASLYAMGYTCDDMLKIFRYFAKNIMRTDARHFAGNLKNSKTLLGYGLISSENIEIVMKECAKEKNVSKLEDIKMPIAIPTVDIMKGKKYVFTNRKTQEENYITDALIAKATRASSSYPGIFTPTEYLDYKFIDGGILDNEPAEEVKKLGADKILTIKFDANLESEPKNIYDIVFKSLDILFEAKAQGAVSISDYTLDIDLAEASLFNIRKIDYCYNQGYITTLQKINEIKQALGE